MEVAGVLDRTAPASGGVVMCETVLLMACMWDGPSEVSGSGWATTSWTVPSENSWFLTTTARFIIAPTTSRVSTSSCNSDGESAFCICDGDQRAWLWEHDPHPSLFNVGVFCSWLGCGGRTAHPPKERENHPHHQQKHAPTQTTQDKRTRAHVQKTTSTSDPHRHIHPTSFSPSLVFQTHTTRVQCCFWHCFRGIILRN